jgi:hypothetical protein
MDIFLDYYIPYAGLCNQLYLITNHIVEAIQKGVNIYIHVVNLDIFHKELVPASVLFDIDKTNENIHRLIGRNVLLSKKPENFILPSELKVYPVQSIEILGCLEFNKHLVVVPEGEYYSVHYRMELDVICHYVFPDKYNTFMDLEDKTEMVHTFMKDPRFVEYITFLFDQYIHYISLIGFDKPWYICTALGKDPVHDILYPMLYKLHDYIRTNGGIVMKTDTYFAQRELNALVDLMALCKSEAMIVFEGSSFSEGYCLKVNKNPKKVCLFVKNECIDSCSDVEKSV